MKQRYSRAYYPAAPALEVVFVSAAEGLRTPALIAMVDTGADGTLVPLQFLDEIHAPTTIDMSVRGQWSDSRRVMLYLVDIQIGNLTLPGVEVAGDTSGTEVVLGRDVLNRLRLTLEGPQETIHLFD